MAAPLQPAMPENNFTSSILNPDIALRGGCRCGRISYISTVLPSDMCNCHCRACRQFSGGPYLTLATFPTASLSWKSHDQIVGSIADDSRLTTYQSNAWAQRGFCAKCGSSIRMHYDCDAGVMLVTAGSIEEESVMGKLPKPECHIFLAEKAGWFEVPDDKLERFEGFSDETYDKKIEGWMRERQIKC